MSAQRRECRQTKTAITVVGIDIGKNSFHVVGLDQRGAIVLRQKWSRGQVEARFADLLPCPKGEMERAASPVKQPGFALCGGRYYVECDRHNAGKTKLLRGYRRKINDPTLLNGPRSLIRTMTVRRFFKLVTRTNVPKGNERCAAVSFAGENNSPLAVLPSFCE
jgi:hypothetical protein